MKFDLDTIRGRFPALSITDNGIPRVYFDNPGGTQVSQQVMDAMNRHMTNSNANVEGPFITSRMATNIVSELRVAAADLLNAPSPAEIVFGQNMTTLTMHLSRSLGRIFSPGDEIVLTRMEHEGNISPWLLLARDFDLKVRWVPFNVETFEFDQDAFDDVLSEKTKLVCIGAANNLIGTINDVKSIAAKARAAGALTFVDAVQSTPHVSTDVQDLGCDFLVCSAYKFFGPHQGILWGRREVLERLEPYKVRPAPEEIPGCFETGTPSIEGMAGTIATIDYFAWVGETMAADYHDRYPEFEGRRKYVHAAMDCLFEYEASLASHLIAGLQQLPGLRVLGITDPTAMDRRVPTVAFTVDGVAPELIANELGARNIFVWYGDNYAVEVARHIGIHETGGAVRVGPVHYNSEAEIDVALNALAQILPSAAVA
jgi:cysteine desulfurase family protein (TIGR01976 family)